MQYGQFLGMLKGRAVSFRKRNFFLFATFCSLGQRFSSLWIFLKPVHLIQIMTFIYMHITYTQYTSIYSIYGIQIMDIQFRLHTSSPLRGSWCGMPRYWLLFQDQQRVIHWKCYGAVAALWSQATSGWWCGWKRLSNWESLLKGYQFGDLRIDFGNEPHVYWPGGFFGNQRIFWEWDQQSFKDVSRTSTVVAGRWNSDFFSQCHRDFFCGICGGAHRLFRRFSGRRCRVRHQGGQALFGEVREL